MQTIAASATTDRYTTVASWLHWLIAVGVMAQIALGWWMIDIPKSPPGVRAYWFNVHKSIGITLGVLVVVRVLWRMTHRPPPLPPHIAPWQRLASQFSHLALYACMVIMPLSGYLGSSFTKYPIKYFGHTLPHWGWDAPALKELCSQVHFIAVVTFMALIALHVLAAIKHLMARDGVFSRIVPGRPVDPFAK